MVAYHAGRLRGASRLGLDTHFELKAVLVFISDFGLQTDFTCEAIDPRNITVVSPDRHLLQVEYALEPVHKDAVCIAVEKRAHPCCRTPGPPA